MSKPIKKRVQHNKFEHTAQETSIGILVVADLIRSHLENVCQEMGITHAQYNVLRILKGAYPSGLPRYEITNRLIEKAPDVTRLIDRLIKLKYVIRTQSPTDKRMSVAMITKKGTVLVEKLNPIILNVHQTLVGKIPQKDQLVLIKACNLILK